MCQQSPRPPTTEERVRHYASISPARYERLAAAARRRQLGLALVVENVYDPHNVSALARSAEGIAALGGPIEKHQNVKPPIEVHINDIAQMRKPHPCGGDRWQVVRIGADIGMRCLTCSHKVLLPRSTFERRLKQLFDADGNPRPSA